MLNDPDSPAKIAIALKDNSLLYQSRNYKRADVRSGSGIGITSVSEILEYYYMHRYDLRIDESEDMYTLTLNVAL